MAIINVYLNFSGQCEKAFNFYKTVFGGEFIYLGRYKDMPVQEGMSAITKEMENNIMHIALPINKEIILMGCDIDKKRSNNYIIGNNISLFISTDSKEEADSLFIALSEDGQVVMPQVMTFWGEYFGKLNDKFGINWMISYNPQ